MVIISVDMMHYWCNLVTEYVDFDPLTGLYPNANGGSELMYRALMSRLDSKYKEKIQFINSRPKEFIWHKKKLLWSHDHFSDPDVDCLNDPAYRKKFSKIVFVSNTQFQMFRAHKGIEYHESEVIKNAIIPITNHEKPKDCLNLIYHTTPHRGLNILIPVFVELVKHFKFPIHLDVYSSFDIYGWGNRNEPYEELFQICRDHPNITYHGFKSNDVIREALKKAHVFAYPNIWPETSCIAAIEAMSAGCLVICPDHDALAETVGDLGINYRFHEDLQTHADLFANILLNVLPRCDTLSIQTLANNAKSYTNEMYSWDRRIHQWNRLCEDIINGQSN